jgi:hypothetical protein
MSKKNADVCQEFPYMCHAAVSVACAQSGTKLTRGFFDDNNGILRSKGACSFIDIGVDTKA